MSWSLHISPLSEHAVLIRPGGDAQPPTEEQLIAWRDQLAALHLPGLLAIVPGLTDITVFFDLLIWKKQTSPAWATLPAAEGVCLFLEEKLAHFSTPLIPATPRTWQIPVRYGGSAGPDLEAVANTLRLSTDEVVRLHTSTAYAVQMIGFLPGFPYLGPLPSALHLPRRATPRLRVEAGSVAIAAAQTGIYPQASPGGWHIIGHTDWILFDPLQHPPARLQVGDRVQFVSRGQ